MRRFSNAKDVQKKIDESTEIVTNVERDIPPPVISVDENGNNIMNDEAIEQNATPANSMGSKALEKVTRESFQLTMLNNEDLTDGNFISSEVSTVEYESTNLLGNGLEADIILSPADLVQQAKLVDDKEFSSICPLCKHNEEMAGCCHMYHELEHHVVEVVKERNENKPSMANEIVNGSYNISNGVEENVNLEDIEHINKKERLEDRNQSKEDIRNKVTVTKEAEVNSNTDNTTLVAKSKDVNQDKEEQTEGEENTFNEVTEGLESHERESDNDEKLSTLIKDQDINTSISKTYSNGNDHDQMLNGKLTENIISKGNVKEEEPSTEVVINEVKEIKDNVNNEKPPVNKTDVIEEVHKPGAATVSFVDQSLATPNPTPRTGRRIFGSFRSKSKKRNKNKINISNLTDDIEKALQGIYLHTILVKTPFFKSSIS